MADLTIDSGDAGDSDGDLRLIGTNLAAARRVAGMTQMQVAEAMARQGFQGWHSTTVSRVERGERRSLNAAEIDALSKMVGADLLAGTELERVVREGFGKITSSVVDSISNAVPVLVPRSRLLELRESLRVAQETLDKILDRNDGKHPEA